MSDVAKVYPPLTVEDFVMRYDADRTYIFTEDEDGTALYTFGHDRDEEFVRQAIEFDIQIGGLDPEDAHCTADDVDHRWAVTLEPPPEWRVSWKGVNHLTLGAFPISALER